MRSINVVGSLMATSLLLFGSACAQVSSQEPIEHEFVISSEQSMEIDLSGGGSIHIRGWDEPRAVIRVILGRTDPDAFRFDFDQRGSTLTVRSERLVQVRLVDIRVEAQVPHGFDLDLHTDGGGISIEDIEGNISGSTGGGELNLRNLKGTIRLTTGGGEISVRDSELEGRVSTGGGAVLVENVNGNFRATSGGGEVIYRNVVTPDRTYPAEVVYIRNAGGRIEVEDAPSGADVSTGGGDIYIRSASSYVKARTGGGDITIDAVDGWVEASTGAGTIRVAMTGDPDEDRRDVSLSTGIGDVYLTIPDGLSTTIDIELGYTRDARRQYRIKSDFDLREERTDTWDTSQGSPRKTIFGRAKFGDGRNTIRIRTTNGNVYLRKRG